MPRKKKKIKKKEFEFSKVGNLLDNIAKSVPIQIDKEIKKKTFISTGVYLVDAALSGRLLGGGVATNRISVFAGESGAGKSFLAYSVAKNAQKEGYSIIYIDTERSVDLEDIPKYGVDNSQDKFRLIRSNKVEDINMTLTQLIDELKKQKMNGVEIPKLMLVLDSLGQMASNKEKEDLLKGSLKQDMTKAKAIGSMFRSINDDLGFLDIPMIVCNHTYLTMDLFPKSVMKGGLSLLYTASVVGFMSKSKLKTGQEDSMDLGKSGITVLFKTEKNRLAKPKKIRFDISFATGMNPYTGLEEFCRPEYFNTVGIAKGKEVVDKETGEINFEPGGNMYYVKSLGKKVAKKNLHNSNVFTPEVLKALEPIVNDYFRFKSVEEIEDVEKEFEKRISDDEDETNGFTDASDASDIFDD